LDHLFAERPAFELRLRNLSNYSRVIFLKYLKCKFKNSKCDKELIAIFFIHKFFT
jgi:hypothetical protein